MPVSIEMSVSETLEAEDEDIPDAALVQQWAEQACFSEEPLVTSVQLVSLDEMRELNNTWRGNNRPTNVLSFPMQSPEEVEPRILGDLALCPAVINSEAAQQHKPATAHWAHMIVHGMLHLQGYDHIDESQANEMEALEARILNRLGFDNPYLENTYQQAAE